MNLDRARAVTTGYMGDDELIWLAMQAATHQRIVEVGSWTGRSTLALADNTPGTVFAIDTWEASPGDLDDILVREGPDWAWNEFVRNTRPSPNLKSLHMRSLAAAYLFNPPPDMVFIDAAHDYHSVIADINAWRPLLAPGGLLCGHDHCPERWPGVRQAVDELLPNRQLMSPNDADHSIWWINV